MTGINSENSDLFDGFRNGSHHLWIVCDSNWRPYDAGDARNLNLDFHVTDWEAVFWQTLNCPKYDYDQSREGNRESFAQSIPNLPMLGRIWHQYEDYVFTVDEAHNLREECCGLLSRAVDPNVSRALRKLIFACDVATEAGCSLMFVCD